MESLYAQRSTAIAFAVCWVVVTLLVWGLHREWWKLRAVRAALWIVPAVMLTSVVAWGVSVRAHAMTPAVAFALVSGFGVTGALGLVVALPFSGAALTIERLVRWIARRSRRGRAHAGDAARTGRATDGAMTHEHRAGMVADATPPAVTGADTAADTVSRRDFVSDAADATSRHGTARHAEDATSRHGTARHAEDATSRHGTARHAEEANSQGTASDAADGFSRERTRDAAGRAHISTPARVDRSRRTFITTAAAALPLVTVGAAGAGVAASYGRTKFPVVPLSYAGLPRELEGLRILHLSDVHLGYFVSLDDLERTMLDAEAHRPDLVLVTGDLSDDLKVLPDALRIIDGLKPRLGTYASIGNHEYYRGIEEVHRAFDRGPIPLLIEESTPIAVRGARLFLAGADDPARTGRFNDARFMRSTVEGSIDAMPSETFSILMSHRPEGFDVAARHGVDLTLSGHYHGGIQLGLGGRAIIQPFRPQVYYWGHYAKGSSQLYTSGGVGHWFPFRLNCPPEAPVYVLQSSTA